jgi:sugar transferase (PEP-CTERM/EpsH1 system associated)
MRILFVVPYVPSRIRVRPYEFIRTLAQSHHVEVACLVSGEDEAADLPALRSVCAAVHPVPHPPLHAAMRMLRKGASGLPLQAAYAISPALKSSVEGMAERFDLIHLEHLRGAATALDTRGVPVVWDAVDCISLLLNEMASAPQPAHVRAIRAIERPRTRRYEALLLRRFPNVIVTSARDAAALWDLRSDGRTTITIIPNGVDLTYFQPQPEQRNPHDIVFTGKMSYHANRTAVHAFVSDVWPAVHSAVPDARFLIVGSDPPREIRDLDGTMGITVTGRVPDIRPYLASAAVAVAPLVYGVGNPNKVLEAMAMAVPMIATPPAVTAIRAGEDDGVIVRARPAMVHALIDILSSPAYGESLGLCGRRYVETHHSWQRAVTQLELVYRAVLSDRQIDRDWAALAAD